MQRTILIIDSDAKGVEMVRFEMPFVYAPFAAGEHTLSTLLETRLVADLGRVQPDVPEAHIPLVQSLRSREKGDEIELFTPPVVDMQAQLRSARIGFEQGDFTVEMDGKAVIQLDGLLDPTTIAQVCSVRYSLILGD
jgi:hypothetical protein